MKRWIALILVIAAFCAMALGSGHKRPIDTSEPDVEALKPQVLPSSAEETAPEAEVEPDGPSFEETVIYDGQNIVVSATGLTYDGGGPAVGIRVENGTTRRVRAALEGLDVNGYRIIAPLELICAPESRTYGKLAVDPDVLAVCGVSEIAQLDLEVALSDAKTGSALPAGQSVRIYTDAALDKIYTADKTGRVVWYDGGVEITVKGRDGRARHDADLVLCLANTNDVPVRVELAGFSVNGAPFEAELSAVLRKGKTYLTVLPVPRETLTERGQTEVERYSLRFEIYDETSGDLLAVTDAISLDYDALLALP